MSNKVMEGFRRACKDDHSRETFNSLESLYKLIIRRDLSALSETPAADFEDMFSRKIVTLYETIPDISLRFVSTLMAELFKPQFLNGSDGDTSYRSQFEVWEQLLRAIINGLETYSESSPKGNAQLGRIFYKPLFGLLSSPAGLKLSARLKIQLYGFLSDLADIPANKELLRQKNVLGGSRLGLVISSTNEYLVLVILLQLLESMLSDNPDEDAVDNIGKEVFQCSNAKKTFGKEGSIKLLKILQNASDTKWDLVADRLIQAMAVADTAKPRPFALAAPQIKANSQVFTHPESLRCIYMDNAAFIVNIEDGDDIDFLDIAFSSITSLGMKEISAPDSRVEITLHLSSPPMRASGTIPSQMNSQTVIFELNPLDLQHFNDALKRRGVERLVEKPRPNASRIKQSVAGQPLDLNNISSISLEVKSIEVEQFYRSSTPEAIVSPKGSASETRFPETDLTAFPSNPSPPVNNERLPGTSPMHISEAVVQELPTNAKPGHTNGCLEEPEEQVSEKAEAAPKNPLKRKRTVEDINEDHDSKEHHYYNSQYLTMTAPFSTRKYKARSRKPDSSYSPTSSSSEDELMLSSSVPDPKPLKKLNIDRPNRLILSAGPKETDKKATTKSVPPAAITNKPRPKPKPKKRRVIVDSDSDDTAYVVPKKPIKENNFPIRTDIHRSPTPLQTISDGDKKPANALPIPIAASSPFNDKVHKVKCFEDEEMEEHMDDLERSIHLPDLGPVMDTDASEKPDDSDCETVKDIGARLLRERIERESVVPVREPSERKALATKILPARPLKSALKHTLHPDSSIVDLTHLEDSDENDAEESLALRVATQERPIPIQLSKYYAAITTADSEKSKAKQVDTSKTSTKRSTVSFKEDLDVEDSLKLNRGYGLANKPRAIQSNGSYSMRIPPTPPSKVSKKSSYPYPKNTKFTFESPQSSTSEEEASTDQKVVMVLNKIHETIVGNLGRKLKHSTVAGNVITNKLRLYAAEELEKMLLESEEHYQNMVKTEKEYAHYGRRLKAGLEEVAKTTEEIHKTLQQTIQDHDSLSLVRKMPPKLAPRPKLL